ncbi:MAG: prepilin-type N-terminal cleavage/methylation domain-containing protein [Planctomycetes bacterium]|nr:prepilin-type N-terminal cleavage/methylation domain-containing protein [Planctomycetota bacterium]
MKQSKFTLIELMVAITLLALMARVLTYSYTQTFEIAMTQSGGFETMSNGRAIVDTVEEDIMNGFFRLSSAATDELGFRYIEDYDDNNDILMFSRKPKVIFDYSKTSAPEGLAGLEYVAYILYDLEGDGYQTLARFTGGATEEFVNTNTEDEFGKVMYRMGLDDEKVLDKDIDNELFIEKVVAENIVDFSILLYDDIGDPRDVADGFVEWPNEYRPSYARMTVSIAPMHGIHAYLYGSIDSMKKDGFNANVSYQAFFNVDAKELVEYDGASFTPPPEGGDELLECRTFTRIISLK